MAGAPSNDLHGIGRWERRSLYLVFGGPVSWWLPMARAVGVRVEPPLSVDDAVLAHAERSALEASRRFGPGLAATAVSVAALIPWLPVQERLLEPIGLAAGLLDLLVFGGIPLYFLRRCTEAAAPAVAVALAQGDEALDGPQAERYPRVALAAERILYPRGR